MGGRIRTRIAVIMLLLLAASGAATCYVIALNAEATVEAATRSRLLVMARFLRSTVEQNIRLGTPLRGPGSLQSVLESAVARDPDLNMVALLGRDGEILTTAGRAETASLTDWVARPPSPPSLTPEIQQTADGLVIRIGIASAFRSHLGELVAVVPQDNLSPDVERLIILLLRGGLLLVVAMVPLVVVAVWLILHPAVRSIGLIAGVLEAMGQGRETAIPPPMLRGRGDPYWDIPDQAEIAAGRLAVVDRFDAARTALLRADDALRKQDRLVSRLDTIGAAALPDEPGGQPQ